MPVSIPETVDSESSSSSSEDENEDENENEEEESDSSEPEENKVCWPLEGLINLIWIFT